MHSANLPRLVSQEVPATTAFLSTGGPLAAEPTSVFVTGICTGLFHWSITNAGHVFYRLLVGQLFEESFETE